jgi:hypothetical protein
MSLLALLLLTGPATAQDAALAVSPANIEFRDAYDRRQLLVEADGQDLTSQARYRSTSDAVATVDERGFVMPVGPGTAQIEITSGDRHASVPVTVTELNSHRPIDFAGEVVPLLSRYGCNSGGCHGKASGQNGFKLSLFGFDGTFDYHALVSEARGRRVFASVPERSLILTKATGQVPHGGGKRFDIGSEPYQVLLAWVESGAPASSPDAPRVDGIRVEPSERILDADALQQLRVIATLTDGAERDITRQTEYFSNYDVVARVDERGLVAATAACGEATIMARYMGHVAVFRAIRPHGPTLTELAGFDPINEIDRLVAAKWMKLGLRPSPVADDATFLRRLTLDLCGRLPTVDETRAFLADGSADKRTQLVERLLASPDYPAYFALKWSVILRNSRLAGSEQAAYAFHNWIKDMIARNRPYDEFVRGIVAASGEWQDAPAINWYWQSRDDQLHTVTADTAQLFMGVRLQCARCHHHPYERWSQEDYYGLAGFFTRLGRKSFGEPPPYYASSSVTTGEKNPLTGGTPEPKYPDGEYATFTPEDDPRHALVDWMAAPGNPFFSKALVNRMWGHFFGRGLVHEIDDLRATNPASNPEVLDDLAGEFERSGFDVQHVIRLIVTSRTYQLSSEPRSENVNDSQNFARYYARRMIAEVALDAIDAACGTRSNFGNMSATARAVDLPHEGFGSYFLDTFDRPQRVTVCECERSPGATLAQVLLLANSDETENKLADGNGRIARLINEQKPTPEIIDELYLACYSRLPTDDERNTTVSYIDTADDRRRAAEDVLWSLVNSKEFLFNH